MKIVTTSVLVDDQARALAFYTDVLGFVKKTDIPTGDARWLTVVSPDAPDGVELLLEPDGHPAAKAVQGGPSRRWHPVHVLRRRRRPGRVRSAQWLWACSSLSRRRRRAR